MKNEIKLIGLDLDGTVFNDEKHITETTKNAIRDAIKKGVIVLPATGRPISGVPQEFLDIEGVHYALTSNGAVVYDVRENKKIVENLIDIDLATRLLDSISHIDCLQEIYIDGKGYSKKGSAKVTLTYVKDKAVAEYIMNTRIAVDSLYDFMKDNNKPVEKIHLLFSDLEAREEARKVLSDFSEVVVTSAIFNNLEINLKNVNKGNGLIELGNVLGIEKDQIMACGDGGNDYEMIKTVGFGVAMGNAIDELKEVADYVTLTNEEDGVAYAINEFVL